jgi:hypothetical protein
MILVIEGPRGSGRTTKAIQYSSHYNHAIIWNCARDFTYSGKNYINYTGSDIDQFKRMTQNGMIDAIILDNFNDTLISIQNPAIRYYFDDSSPDNALEKSTDDKLMEFFVSATQARQDIILVKDTIPLGLPKVDHFLEMFPIIKTKSLIK